MKFRRNHLLAAVSALAHAAMLILFLRASPEAVIGPDVGAMAVSLFPGAITAAVAQPPAPPEATVAPDPPEAPVEPPPDVEPQFVEMEPEERPPDERDPLTDPVALSVATAASGASGPECRLAEWLQAALQADPQVQLALAGIPRPARSVANAVMLWDGAWVEPPRSAGPGIESIRTALVSGVRAAPPACQDQLIRGPELISLTEAASGATVLAIGSGEWRWIELLAPPMPYRLGLASQQR